MKRKVVIIVSIVVAALALAAGGFWYYRYQLHVYEPEMLEPEVFEDVEYDTDLLIGLWQSGSVFYRFDYDGVGRTWDSADDILEEEAPIFEWQLDHSRFTHIHKMELNGAIPKVYRLAQLDLQTLVFEDDFGNVFSFEKVE